MQSPPATIAWTRVSTLRPGRCCAGPVAEVDQLVDDLLHPQPLGQRGGQQQAGVGDRVVVVEGDVELGPGLCEDGIEKVPSDRGSMTPRNRHSPCSEGPSHNHVTTRAAGARWIQAKPSIPDKDEGAGSSPARPTKPAPDQ